MFEIIKNFLGIKSKTDPRLPACVIVYFGPGDPKQDKLIHHGVVFKSLYGDEKDFIQTRCGKVYEQFSGYTTSEYPNCENCYKTMYRECKGCNGRGTVTVSCSDCKGAGRFEVSKLKED